MKRGTSCVMLVALALAAAACGGGDDAADDSEPDDAPASSEPGDQPGDTTESSAAAPAGPPADLPADCAATLVDLDMSAVPEHSGMFDAQTALGVATPIVPNGDGSLDELDRQGFSDLGAATDLLFYTQWLGDHPFVLDDVSMFSGPDAPSGAVTLGVTVVPPTLDGLSVGQTVSSSDELELGTITSFGVVGLFYDPAEGVETYFLVDNSDETQGGTAEILHVDDDWLCVRWDLAGETREPEGTYTFSGVVVTPLERADDPFT